MQNQKLKKIQLGSMECMTWIQKMEKMSGGNGKCHERCFEKMGGHLPSEKEDEDE